MKSDNFTTIHFILTPVDVSSPFEYSLALKFIFTLHRCTSDSNWDYWNSRYFKIQNALLTHIPPRKPPWVFSYSKKILYTIYVFCFYMGKSPMGKWLIHQFHTYDFRTFGMYVYLYDNFKRPRTGQRKGFENYKHLLKTYFECLVRFSG